MAILDLKVAGEHELFVRHFSMDEGVSELFTVTLLVRSRDHSLDFSSIVGKPASFRLQAGYEHVAGGGTRALAGIVSYAEQVEALQEVSAEDGLSTYVLCIVPDLWLLTQRRGNRIFQHLSIPDIVKRVLGEFGISGEWRIDGGAYPKLEFKVQYAETDYDFVSRLLEEAGVAFVFEDGGRLVFSDALEAGPKRKGPPIPYVDNPSTAAEKEYVKNVGIGRVVRPGAVAYRDYDPRHPELELTALAAPHTGVEKPLEQYHYDAGAFLVETGKAGFTPVADDKGFARHDHTYGYGLARHTLEAARADHRDVTVEGNTLDLSPGVVFSIARHPHPELPEGRSLVVVESKLSGSDTGEFEMSARAFFTDYKYRPPKKTPKPLLHGVQSATVVGPAGQEIHTDEYGRVRVQFPWDREGKRDDDSSCWIHVNQGWGGLGYGMLNLPRVGQEVLVVFLEGDPDQPEVVGRVFNAIQQVPYKLPQHKTRSTWKSDTSLGGGGFNEIMFEDLAEKELVWQQAQKDRRRKVENDEFATIVHDRTKLVKNDENERIEGNQKLWVGKNLDAVTKTNKHEWIEKNAHLVVKGSRREEVTGKHSLTVKKDLQEKVNGSLALRAGSDVHHVAGENWVGEGGGDATVKGPGGFLRIDGGGITISGTMVWINERGSPGKGRGAKAEAPAFGEQTGPKLDEGLGEGSGQLGDEEEASCQH
ncbi:type VI secretion system tip protein VgrG [Polyangium jinanense]|uniref:type VI secretion system Vgr family protein n=1 Tax=Polyangium jinanense TaxID=2829994 RepID=UPI0023421E5E|nr:type VI secretion system tip protein TssI/VgrG [Polyangium jinanense]MDC3953111.1 type VI secretion system tip protein VgrG [Polyangium jinanense]